jgi:hypothetical protein
VDAFFQHLTSHQFVDFECECNERYLQYTKNHAWPDGTTEECKQFIACLNNEVGAAVKVLTGIAEALKATVTTGLIEHKEIANESSYNSDCFDPAPETYQELTQCNCLKGLVKTCGDDAGTLPADECLKYHACGHEQVCPVWKQANCPAASLQLHARGVPDALAGDTALQTSARRLDETLQSKCA